MPCCEAGQGFCAVLVFVVNPVPNMTVMAGMLVRMKLKLLVFISVVFAALSGIVMVPSCCIRVECSNRLSCQLVCNYGSNAAGLSLSDFFAKLLLSLRYFGHHQGSEGNSQKRRKPCCAASFKAFPTLLSAARQGRDPGSARES